MGRQPCCDKVGLKKGPWTAEEDKKLINFILRNGQCCWRAVPKLAGLLRCGKSCRLRWTNYLRPDLKRGLLSDYEEKMVIDLHAQLGNKWSKIASHLPGRTDNEIKNHWNTHIKKKLKKMGIDPVTHKPLSTTIDDKESQSCKNIQTPLMDQSTITDALEEEEEDNKNMETTPTFDPPLLQQVVNNGSFSSDHEILSTNSPSSSSSVEDSNNNNNNNVGNCLLEDWDFLPSFDWQCDYTNEVGLWLLEDDYFNTASLEVLINGDNHNHNNDNITNHHHHHNPFTIFVADEESWKLDEQLL